MTNVDILNEYFNSSECTNLGAQVAWFKLVEEKFTSTNNAMDAICTCSEAVCRYRSATEPNLCLDPTDFCKYKQHQ